MAITSEYLTYAEEREEEIRDCHDYFFKNLEYSILEEGERKIIGEIDIMGYDEDGTLTIYEFKSSRYGVQKSKGRKQLKRARDYYEEYDLEIDGEEKDVKNIVLVLEMFGPDNNRNIGTERTFVEN